MTVTVVVDNRNFTIKVFKNEEEAAVFKTKLEREHLLDGFLLANITMKTCRVH